MMSHDDLKWLRTTFELAEQSLALDDGPFAAVLVSPGGDPLLESLQTRTRTNDATAHAETTLCSLASRQFSRDFLTNCTLYSSTEPCPMCAGAIAWTGIGRVVFGVSQARSYNAYAGRLSARFREPPSCKAVFDNLQPAIVVVGPLLEEEGVRVHEMDARKIESGK
jgi:tRNA(Arg) A34 adenosine deaminase TadA